MFLHRSMGYMVGWLAGRLVGCLFIERIFSRVRRIQPTAAVAHRMNATLLYSVCENSSVGASPSINATIFVFVLQGRLQLGALSVKDKWSYSPSSNKIEETVWNKRMCKMGAG